MQVVDPSDQFGRLHALDIQVEYETLLAACRNPLCWGWELKLTSVP
jgi:hypothetical protein